MRDNVHLEVENKKFEDGSTQGGTGTSSDVLKSKNYSEQIHRALYENSITTIFVFIKTSCLQKNLSLWNFHDLQNLYLSNRSSSFLPQLVEELRDGSK